MLTLSRAALLAAALIAPIGGAFAVPLTLEQAVSRAIAAAPGENIAGTGNYSLLEQSEITASYSQAIERGGKRTARVALAERDIAAAEAASGVLEACLQAPAEAV